MKKKSDLPKGIYLEKNGRYRAQYNIFDHNKWKYVIFSCRSYDTLEHAEKARQIVEDLVGTDRDRKKRVRRWKVTEAVNEYRTTLNLPLIKEKL